MSSLKPFGKFFKETFLAVESILYTDRTLFARILNEELTPTEAEISQLDVDLADPETAKKYLNNEEEIELIKIYKANPDSVEGLDARNKVIENKLKYIHLLAHKAANAGRIPKEQHADAVQNAVLSLIHGIDLFDPDKGVPFTAYAKQWIMSGITNPFNPARQKSIHSDAIGKEPGFSLTSIDTPTTKGDSDDKAMTVGDTIPDTRDGLHPEDVLDDKEMRAKLKIYLSKLDEREAKAITMRFSTKPDGKEYTYDEIGKELGMTKMGAKSLCDRTLAKLKTFAKEEC
jgi:RNA polymerase sigma factor (sigma-70 family)